MSVTLQGIDDPEFVAVASELAAASIIASQSDKYVNNADEAVKVFVDMLEALAIRKGVHSKK